MNPGTIQSLNDAYREYCLGKSDQVVVDYQKICKYLVEHNCTFRGAPMPTLLKPNFISPKQRELLVWSVEMMGRILTKFIALYLADAEVREIMGFSEKEDELFRIDPGYKNPLVISRLDAFLSGYDLKFLEFNCDSPAGIAYADIQEEGFREILLQYPFLENYHIEYMLRQHILLNSLLQCYAEFRRNHLKLPEKPVIAIVDWDDVSTYSEFELHREYFREHGFEAVIATPQEFTIANGKVRASGQEVHLVYRRVITRELVERWEEVGTFLEAIREGLLCCCNSFRSFIVGNKKVLAVLTDQGFNSFFSKKEQGLIRKAIPWTGILSDSHATYHGREVMLPDFILENKDQLVLKPSNMYGGKDVHIGRLTPRTIWEAIINQNMEDQDWVVQDYVPTPVDLYPEVTDRVIFKPKYVNINPFAINGTYCGTITRVSDNQVINVSAGGGLVPTLTATKMGSMDE